MDERGKLKFPEASGIKNNEKLKKLKKHWESFASSEVDEREKYLRSLEVQFSMNSMVESKETEEATEFITSMFAEKKVDEQEISKLQQLGESRLHARNRVTDKR